MRSSHLRSVGQVPGCQAWGAQRKNRVRVRFRGLEAGWNGGKGKGLKMTILDNTLNWEKLR
jgi:hypothetical protein